MFKKFSKFEKVYPVVTLLPCIVFAAGAALQFGKEPFFSFFNAFAALALFFTFLWEIIPRKKWRRVFSVGIVAAGIACAIRSIVAKQPLYVVASLIIAAACLLACAKYGVQEIQTAVKEQKQ